MSSHVHIVVKLTDIHIRNDYTCPDCIIKNTVRMTGCQGIEED